MNKDVIYIDVDDDVTAIIGKIKKAKEKIVALVPPKRVGTLQSAVNLRLLDRLARSEKKQLVLITGNQALIALAANAKIPVAKNLQSKPELAEIPAMIVDDGDDIINGADLPVGEHAKTVTVNDGTRVPENTRSEDIDATDLNIDGENVALGAAAVSSDVSRRAAASTKPKNRIKIPNFDTFRKKLVLIIAGAGAFVALLVWMFIFAPAATVVITASTTPQPVSTSVKLGGTAATDYKTGVISSVSQQEKKDEVVEFTATGVGKVGDKATGTVTFRNYESPNPITIPAGTTLTADGMNYITKEAGTASGAGFMSEGTSGPVAIEAAEVGAEYNVDSGTVFSVSGHNSSGATYFRARATTDVDGGTSKEVKVVSADDIERAKGQLLGESTDDQKQALIKKFTNGEKVIETSFTVERGKTVSSPAQGAEAADGKAKLTISTTYSIQAVSATDLESYLKSYLESKIDEDAQKIYSAGVDNASLSNFRKEDDTMLVTLTANASVGPKIDETQIKEEVKGKKFGEVQQSLKSKEGIKEIDIHFSYFWVTTVPNSTDKIKIEFKVDDNGEQ